MRYPIIEEAQLGAVERKLFRRPRRDMSNLPRQLPGTVLVFHINNDYEVAPVSRLRGDEPIVVNAASVSVVNLRQQQVPVTITLPSAQPASAFKVVVTFDCRVHDARAVVATHSDLTAKLSSYLLNRELRAQSSEFLLTQLSEAQIALAALIEARFSIVPPDLDGVDIEVGDIEVSLPTEEVDFQRSKQQLTRSQFLEAMSREFDRTESALIEEILDRGPHAVEALAIRLGEVNVGNATIRSYGEADKATARLVDLLSKLAESGHVNEVAVDTPQLIDKLVSRINGRSESVTYRDAVGGTEPAPSIGARPAPRQDRTGGDDGAREWRGGSSKPQDVDDDF